MRYLFLYITFILTPSFVFAYHTTTDTLYWSSPSAWPEGQVPKAGESVVIPKGKIMLLDISPEPLLSIKIKGALLVQDRQDISIKVAKLIVAENALLSIGRIDQPFRHQLNLFFIDQLGTENGLTVKAGGRLLVYGKSETEELSAWKSNQAPAHNQAYPRHTVFFKSSGNARIRIQDEAALLQIDGVDFKGLGGITRKGYAVEIGDLSEDNSQSKTSQSISPEGFYNYIRNCNFSNIASGVIQLDKTQRFTIENNQFHQINGPAIQCAPSGIGWGNRFHNNLIAFCRLHDETQTLGAIHVFHPGQSIRQNKVFAVSGGNAYRFEAPPAYENYDWTKTSSTFDFQSNLAQGFQSTRASQQHHYMAALHFGYFEHHQIWTLKGNQFTDFPLGIHNLNKNILIDSTLILNCSSGLIPGGAAFSRTQIIFEEGYCVTSHPEVAILADGMEQLNAPVIHQLWVKGYPIHLKFKGPIAAHHDFSKLEFDREATIHFTDFPKEQQIRIRNTQLPYDANKMKNRHSSHLVDRPGKLVSLHSKTDKRKTLDPQEHHHHHHAQKPEVQWVVLPPASPFISPICQAMANGQSYVCPSEAFGQVTISTGLGLDDPVHEHHRLFEDLSIRPSGQGWIPMSAQPGNRISLDVATNSVYELRWTNVQDLTDISCEWAAAPESHIELRFSYPFEQPFGFRSFGEKVPELKSMDALRQSKQTCFYINPSNQTAHLKIVNEGNYDDLVLYSFTTDTEITINQQAVPIKIDFKHNTQKLSLAYHLPKAAPVKLELLDYFGNTRAVLVDKKERKGNHKVFIPLAVYPLDKALYFYSLEVAGQKHKGPLYITDKE